MNKESFVLHTMRLVGCAHNANIIAQAFGCDVDCEGFIGDLIDGYGNLILKYVQKENDEEVYESFWNDIVYSNASLPEIRAFYEERIKR